MCCPKVRNSLGKEVKPSLEDCFQTIWLIGTKLTGTLAHEQRKSFAWPNVRFESRGRRVVIPKKKYEFDPCVPTAGPIGMRLTGRLAHDQGKSFAWPNVRFESRGNLLSWCWQGYFESWPDCFGFAHGDDIYPALSGFFGYNVRFESRGRGVVHIGSSRYPGLIGTSGWLGPRVELEYYILSLSLREMHVYVSTCVCVNVSVSTSMCVNLRKDFTISI